MQAEHSNSTAGWTDNPTTRGTLDIVYSCLFTVIACTWSILHPNIPDPSISSFARVLQKVKLMVFNIFCPELMFVSAVFASRRDRRDISCFRTSAQKHSLIEHEFMGGWVIQEKRGWAPRFLAFWRLCRKNPERLNFENNETYSPLGTSLLKHEGNNPKLWTITHTTYLNMGGLRVEIRDPSQSDHYFKRYDIAARHFADPSLFDPAYSPLKIFSMSENEILDKSKGDGFTKSITVMQIFWLVMSIVMRKARGLSSSQLEILTLAFAVLAMATYLAQWNKPKCINMPTTIYLERFSDDAHKAEAIAAKLEGAIDRGNGVLDLFIVLPYKYTVAFSFTGAIYGSLHCLAWKLSFPSIIELIMWRVASITALSVPLIMSLIGFLNSFMEFSENVVHVILWLYILARLAIIGIAFSSLRSMPASEYLTTWSKYIPNIQ